MARLIDLARNDLKCVEGHKTPTQPKNTDEVKYARKGIVTILWDQLHQAYIQQDLAKKSRWVLKCLCECRETMHTKYVGLLATEMLFNDH